MITESGDYQTKREKINRKFKKTPFWLEHNDEGGGSYYPKYKIMFKDQNGHPRVLFKLKSPSWGCGSLIAYQFSSFWLHSVKVHKWLPTLTLLLDYVQYITGCYNYLQAVGQSKDELKTRLKEIGFKDLGGFYNHTMGHNTHFYVRALGHPSEIENRYLIRHIRDDKQENLELDEAGIEKLKKEVAAKIAKNS
jgi:hypothetical protein